MIARLMTFVLFGLAAVLPAAAQDDAPGKAGRYVLLLDKENKPLAGSYQLSPDLKMVLSSGENAGLPRDPIYLDRAFFPTREGELLSFYNARHAYSPDPTALDVGEEARIVDSETLLPPLFKDQEPKRETARRLAVSGRVALSIGGRKLIGKSYRVDGDKPGDEGQGLGEYVHIETLDLVLPAAAARNIASIETGDALSSGDFHALYVERSPATDAFVRCIAEKRRTAEYRALAEKQKNSVDAFMAAEFVTAGKVFWADKALYETNYAMSVYTLCPP